MYTVTRAECLCSSINTDPDFSYSDLHAWRTSSTYSNSSLWNEKISDSQPLVRHA
ncbi:Uncharacterised protein [Mycobacterium tuberculosis]|uniref:Uncharacterized protein n=1 Tax=Mycobacterium tuberculosis TaxID=1773 RepID=A0A655I7P8_MYCTX|nr:Uncharacterised protein [Mycobacterium tuberculosis]CFE79547.1 Uncharacterised protein [Mycobacterium tuberculosis]CFS38288.1 Uncharacterised protein [Mycobacterium tuberculosis]CKQ64143.1 Uncharacterised protein [Mycobacterium tuberculosis]COV59909.1 Uncharacterised protein [Mycobacterium tuberculosis]